VTRYDESRRRVISAHRLWYHDLLLREDVNPPIDPHQSGRALAEALRSEAPSLFRANPQAAGWLARLEFASQALPEIDWPDFNDDVFAELLTVICQGKTGLDEVEQVDLIPFLQSRLNPAQLRELQQGAPQSLTLPTGRQVQLVYSPGKPPVLAARVQELFGWTETPRVARGRVPILLHLLAPNNRPVQITNDLRSFWTSAYHQVRKELRGRYPKHAWPEDPFRARPASKRNRP
jgi:ATP-dependent helicase HrpB